MEPSDAKGLGQMTSLELAKSHQQDLEEQLLGYFGKGQDNQLLDLCTVASKTAPSFSMNRALLLVCVVSVTCY